MWNPPRLHAHRRRGPAPSLRASRRFRFKDLEKIIIIVRIEIIIRITIIIIVEIIITITIIMVII